MPLCFQLFEDITVSEIHRGHVFSGKSQCREHFNHVFFRQRIVAVEFAALLILFYQVGDGGVATLCPSSQEAAPAAQQRRPVLLRDLAGSASLNGPSVENPGHKGFSILYGPR